MEFTVKIQVSENQTHQSVLSFGNAVTWLHAFMRSISRLQIMDFEVVEKTGVFGEIRLEIIGNLVARGHFGPLSMESYSYGRFVDA